VWVVFAGSLAERAVTLVSVPSASGETPPVPHGRRWAASIGTLTFAIGVVSQRWAVACVGVVFSWLTCAAVWQNFRTRLPFLLDPWSEPAPQAPTILHGMVAISAAQEVMAIVGGIAVAAVGSERLWFAIAIAYGIAALVMGAGLLIWLDRRDVRSRVLWVWSEGPLASRCLLGGVGTGIAAGVALGLAAQGYLWVVQQLARWGLLTVSPLVLHASDRKWLAVMAIGLAPLGEELLFRGLLFKSLAREWSLGRALLGSACFFAMYHPPLAWVPVGLMGAASALLFKRTGHLLPSVLLHATYNAVVVWML
jgi:membrane protease YdiL (CAAX protease family)